MLSPPTQNQEHHICSSVYMVFLHMLGAPFNCIEIGKIASFYPGVLHWLTSMDRQTLMNGVFLLHAPTFSINYSNEENYTVQIYLGFWVSFWINKVSVYFFLTAFVPSCLGDIICGLPNSNHNINFTKLLKDSFDIEVSPELSFWASIAFTLCIRVGFSTTLHKSM